MILLLGGTSETAKLATALAEANRRVLVSTATDVELDIGTHPNISRRCGRLNVQSMIELIAALGIRAVADAAHPYALLLHETAREATSRTGVPLFNYRRAATGPVDGAVVVADHAAAAKAAFSFGAPVLLTTGSRNLAVYAERARATRIRLIARVLPHPESLSACRVAGLAETDVIAARGPFSVSENCGQIRRFGVGAIVTKDSGAAGGVLEKLEAAALEGCRVVMLARPPTADRGYASAIQLVQAVLAQIPPA